MVNQNLVKYLQEGKRRGFDISLLKQKLLEGGFQRNEIDEAANFLLQIDNPSSQIQPQVKSLQPVPPSPVGMNQASQVSQASEKSGSNTNSSQGQNQQVSAPPSQTPAPKAPENPSAASPPKFVYPVQSPTQSSSVPAPTAPNAPVVQNISVIVQAPSSTSPNSSPTISPMSGSNNLKIGFFSKIGKSFSSPFELFDKTKNESLIKPLLYKYVLSTILFAGWIAVILFLGDFIIQPLIADVASLVSDSWATLLGNVASSLKETTAVSMWLAGIIFIGLPIADFVLAGVLFLFMRLYSGKGSFTDTYRAVVYGQTPFLLFSFIPFAGWVATPIWSMVVLIIGLSETHQASKIRAFFSLLSIALIIIIAILIYIVFTLYTGPQTVVVPQANTIPINQTS